MPIALPGRSSSSPPSQSTAGGTQYGLLRVVSPAELDQADRDSLARAQSARQPSETPDIGSWIRQQWYIFRNHRNLGNNPMNWRLLRSQRMFEGKYDPEKLTQIQAFGGSEVYSRLVAGKARGATSLLRDVYLGPERPWTLDPQKDPPIPPEVRANIMRLIQTEVATLQASNQPPQQDQVHMRYVSLLHSAQQAARRRAESEASDAADRLDDILIEGQFYQALAEFLLDLPLFPYACLKGPVVRMVPRLTWAGNMPSINNQPSMFWERVNPFNLYWDPGASSIEEATIIERKRYTRSDLNDLIGLPGYNEIAVRASLEDYANGLREWLDAPDPEQAINEGREDPNLNRAKYIEGIEYHGPMQGRLLLDQGVDRRLIQDLDRDYMVQSHVVGRHTLKTVINPSPRQRHPYFLTSFEKIPGTVAGHCLPDILEDLQEVSNAAFRSLVNNLAISSGPQVVINDEMIAPTEHSDELYPWKRWHVMGDPLGNQREPITFFQPQSNAQELLLIINQVNTLADESSGIPRYMTGESLSGGAGRTASGLGMLMNNAEKVAQTVAANIDRDVLDPAIKHLLDMFRLTDTLGLLSGDVIVHVKGSEAQIEKTQAQQKRLQFLQMTANPIDMEIVGQLGRARLLRYLANDLDCPDDIVPDDETMQAQITAQKQAQAMGNALVAHAQAQGAQIPGHAQQGGQARPPGGGGQGMRPGSPPGAGGGGGSTGAGMPLSMGPATAGAHPPGMPMGSGAGMPAPNAGARPQMNAFAGAR